jgi:hypothetical protein
MLEKVRGVSHGGDDQLTSSSLDYHNLVTFLELLGAPIAEGNLSTLPDFWRGISLANPQETLRRAAIIIAGRLPTEDELNTAEFADDTVLRKAIRDLMVGDEFHAFLIRGANDRLHTDGFLHGLNLDLSDLNATSFFPVGSNKFYFDQPSTESELQLKQQWEREWAWGLARSPLELIAYTIMEDRSYQEVMTADYMMLNFQTSEILNSGIEFETEDHRLYKPGKNKGQIAINDQLVSSFEFDFGTHVESHGGFIDFPHAGILNSYAFLNRYPSTETNRNRARARWIYYHFLGLDIEKSAARTTDPEALADTDNPTLNNPACTVCHSIHDPLAGAFQNYGNEGIYRDQWEGLDSLPQTYKYPELFDENAEFSDYQYGDTWYRDMRKPGFGTELAPDPVNSLAWAAELIAEDPHFATAAVKFWWHSLMGDKPLSVPESSADANFQPLLEAFEVQNAFINDLGVKFATGIDGGKSV